MQPKRPPKAQADNTRVAMSKPPKPSPVDEFALRYEGNRDFKRPPITDTPAFPEYNPHVKWASSPRKK